MSLSSHEKRTRELKCLRGSKRGQSQSDARFPWQSRVVTLRCTENPHLTWEVIWPEWALSPSVHKLVVSLPGPGLVSHTCTARLKPNRCYLGWCWLAEKKLYVFHLIMSSYAFEHQVSSCDCLGLMQNDPFTILPISEACVKCISQIFQPHSLCQMVPVLFPFATHNSEYFTWTSYVGPLLFECYVTKSLIFAHQVLRGKCQVHQICEFKHLTCTW